MHTQTLHTQNHTVLRSPTRSPTLLHPSHGQSATHHCYTAHAPAYSRAVLEAMYAIIHAHRHSAISCVCVCVCVCARTRVPPVTNKETNTYTKKQTHMAAHACMRTECSGFECSGFGTHEDLDSRCLSPCEARTGPNRCLVYLQHFADPRASPRHPCFPANTNSSDMSNTGNNSDMSSSSYNSRPQLRTLAATTANLSLGPS